MEKELKLRELNHKAYCLLGAADGDFFEDTETLERYVKELPDDLKELGIDVSVDGISMDNLSDYTDALCEIDEATSPV